MAFSDCEWFGRGNASRNPLSSWDPLHLLALGWLQNIHPKNLLFGLFFFREVLVQDHSPCHPRLPGTDPIFGPQARLFGVFVLVF